MKALLISLVLTLSAFSVFATTSNGKTIFKQKCMSCHGDANAFAKVPILYGQEPGYIRNQLHAFKSGDRQDSNMNYMNNIVKSLSDADIKAVASYVAGLEPCDAKMVIDTQADGFMEKYKAGAELVKNNNCMHCHDKYHHAAPRLYGQNTEYLKFTLTEFKNGSRKNKYMDRILPILENETIENLAVYLNAQRVFRECQ